MKKSTSIFVIISVIVLLLLIEHRFNLFYYLTLQFSNERYISHVADTNYEESLLNEPICVNDKAFGNKELIETDLSDVASHLEMHDELADKYNLDSVATGDGDFEKALQILDWLTEHTFYNGAQLRSITDNTLHILKYSFDKPFTNAINCRWKAIALADCLMAVGIKAYPVCMESTEFKNCHFTCQVYISELDKWCVFDPSFGCWFSDSEGTPIDIFEMREMFLQDLEPVVNGYNFNGTDECFDVYLNGFLKHCISNLSTWQNNSMDGRTSTRFSARKEFNARIPRD